MKTATTILQVLLFVAAVAAAIWFLPVRVLIAVLFLFQLLTLAALGLQIKTRHEEEA